ncbi:MAG: aspartate/glutamate racemase family protein [Ruminococcaceae bacterium]|nr:aspartate/glutamate racemase family protein [Oscillospiraceae bacterium]
MENSKIALLRWESGKIPEPLMQLETLPGNSTNLDSYPFPVRLVEVKGANMDTVLFNPSQKLLEDMIQISKDLYAEGVRAITTSCGFNAIFQEAMAEAVPEVTFTSSLLQVPFAQTIVGKNRKVMILTANKSYLSEDHLRRSGITDLSNVIVYGLEDCTEWSKMFTDPDATIDMEVVTKEIMGVAHKALEENSDIGAIVMECTDLPPFAYRMREETGLPVFDYNSMVGHMAMALNMHKLY